MAVGAQREGAARPPRAPDNFRAITAVASVAAPLVLVAIVLVIAQQAWPAITRFGTSFLVSREWNPVTEHFGALPFVFGTLITAV